jgi:hypothetical protein
MSLSARELATSENSPSEVATVRSAPDDDQLIKALPQADGRLLDPAIFDMVATQAFKGLLAVADR